MNLFFDTSALVKYFHAEAGTEIVVELIDNPENQVSIYSNLAEIPCEESILTAFLSKETNVSAPSQLPS